MPAVQSHRCHCLQPAAAKDCTEPSPPRHVVAATIRHRLAETLRNIAVRSFENEMPSLNLCVVLGEPATINDIKFDAAFGPRRPPHKVHLPPTIQ